MRDTQADKDVLLLYGNRTEADIVFRDELAAIEAGEHPRLKVVHILSQPGDDWTGETGFVDREIIERFCLERLATQAFYICGPPVMMDSVAQALLALGVPSERIHHERFAL